tara:strand:- start:294 stop:902 length:609 start_codon:yes stop_codon:yes gene_type:complete
MLINEILKEGVDNIAVFYGGRFQPMHQGHRDVYKHLVSKFGADNVFIATTFSQKAQKAHAGGNYGEDPFTFDEKASIMNKMFGIPADKIVKTNPYRPDLSAVGKDPSNTATILVYGEKDASRLETGKGFLHDLPKDMSELVPTANERGYVYVAPIMQGGMSASDFRKVMASEVDKQEKVKAFNQFFGKYDENIFAFIEDRLK